MMVGALTEAAVGALGAVIAAVVVAGPAWAVQWRRNNRQHGRALAQLEELGEGQAEIRSEAVTGIGTILDLLGDVRSWQTEHTRSHARQLEAVRALAAANPELVWPPAMTDCLAPPIVTNQQEQEIAT